MEPQLATLQCFRIFTETTPAAVGEVMALFQEAALVPQFLMVRRQSGLLWITANFDDLDDETALALTARLARLACVRTAAVELLHPTIPAR